MFIMSLLYGLPGLALMVFGIYALNRETGGVVRSVGYLLSASGTALLLAAILITLESGMSGVLL